MKNRFNGLTGEVNLAFNQRSRRYFELHKLEVDGIRKEKGDIRKLIDSRMHRFGCIEPSITQLEEYHV